MTYDEALSVLGLQRGFTEAEHKKAYRDKVKKYHPDLNPSPAAEVIMRKINEAEDYINSHMNGAVVKAYTHRTIFDIILS